MFNKVYAYVAGLLAVVGAALGLYLKGRNEGKKVEQAKAVQKDLQAEKAKNETLRTVHEVESDVSALSDADAERRLRDKYTRD